MRIALIADVFPPLRSSGAVQLRDLSAEFVAQGHQVTVLTPDADIHVPFVIETIEGVRVCRLKAPRTKDINFIARTVGECIMPYAMLRGLRRSPLSKETWDGVIWYSPSIFLGPVASALKRSSACPGYLIVRDIFPEWAVDMGLMSRGLPYRFFKKIEQSQYAVADAIGVQSPTNLPYFSRWMRDGRRVEVLPNWLAAPLDGHCSLNLEQTSLAGRKIVVYAGNMGVAQGLDVMLEVAHILRSAPDLGFAFVGRGTERSRLQRESNSLGLDNVEFFDEIDPSEIPSLYRQCAAGLVLLDPRHKTHNVPGKFLSYMHSGLPVVAAVNAGNELADVIEAERVGHATVERSAEAIAELVRKIVDQDTSSLNAMSDRCTALARRLFMPAYAVDRIVSSLHDARAGS